jgi:hypothetical protein
MISVQTILVAIIGGVGGGVLATVLRIRHERQEAFRDRQITAADDLATGLGQAIIGLEQAHSTCLEHAFLTGDDKLIFRDPATGAIPLESDEALKHAKGLIATADSRRARISLLFGSVSAPDRAATLALYGLEESSRALNERPIPDLKKYSREQGQARKYLTQFNECALADAKGRPWYTHSAPVLWARRRLRRWRERRRSADS